MAEAEAISVESEALAGDSFKAAIAWRGVRAEALAARGEHAAAIAFARAAVEIAAATDDLLDHADARQALAVALRAGGRRAEADAEVKRAIDLWEAKGATLLAERARRSATRSNELPRTPDPSAMPVLIALRRVRPNAAARAMARSAAAIEARDVEAIAALHSDAAEYVDHPGGVSYGREGFLASLRSLAKARDLTFQQEPLAVLGDSLALARRFSSASGVAGATFDVAAYEREALNLFEVDAEGLVRRIEVFAPDHLGDGVARLYARYAELLPEGPERTRAAATACAVSVLLGPADPDRWAMALAPAVEFTDHRSVGLLGFGRGAEAVLRGMQSLLDVADGVSNRIDDVVELRSDAFLVRWTNLGTARDGGGAFERRYLQLFVFGSDGLATRMEWFDADRDAEALARFDELAAAAAPARPTRRRVRPNAATANLARGEAAIAARDSWALPALFSDDYEAVDHTTGTSWDRKGVLAGWRSLINARNPTSRHEPLATLGDSLTLYRSRTSASEFSLGDLDIGAFEREQVNVTEVDAQGRRRRWESFASHRLGHAVARLYERYAELLPDGLARERAAATARSVAALLGPFDLARYAPALAPAIGFVDHRFIGLEPTRGSEAYLRLLRALLEIADGITTRVDDVVDLRSDALLVRWANLGTERAGGGAYERQFLRLFVFGADGLLMRSEFFDLDREAEALARFDALTVVAPMPHAHIENAVTRVEPAFQRAWEARDWKAFAALYPAHFRSIDRRPLMHLEAGRDDLLAGLRPFFEMGVMRSTQLLATRGEGLALYRMRLSGSVGLTGPSEVELLQVTETDASGQRSAGIAFGPDDLDAAYAELDARYHAGEAAPHQRVSAGMQEFKRAFTERDWDALAARCAPDLVVHDHRLLGWETLHGPAAYIEALRSLVELAPDTRLRIDHSTIRENGYLVITVWEGTREGGAYEAPSLMVAELDGQGRIRRFDQYDLERLDQAQARFAELHHDPLRIPPNVATRAGDRWLECVAARDWDALRALCAPIVFEDRRRLSLTTGACDLVVANNQVIAELGGRASRSVLATSGDRLALDRVYWRVADQGAVSEVETLQITEVDAEGRVVAGIVFDPDDRRAASAELRERFFRGDAARLLPAEYMAAVRAVDDRDVEKLRVALHEAFVFEDHRKIGFGRFERDQFIAFLAALFEQSRDAIIEPLYYVALEERSFLAVAHNFGTLAEGGEYESVFLQVGNRSGLELFDLEDLEAARARFEALRC